MTADNARYTLVLAPTHAYYVDRALQPLVDEKRLHALYLEVNGIYIVDHDNERAGEDPDFNFDRALAAWTSSVLAVLARLSARSFGLVEIFFERGRLLRRARWVKDTMPGRCCWGAIAGMTNCDPGTFFWTTLKQEVADPIEALCLEGLVDPTDLDWWATYGWEEDFLLIQPNVLAPADLCRIIEQCTGFEVRHSAEKFVSHAERVNT